MLFFLLPSLSPASEADLAQLARMGFYDPEFAAERGLPAEAIALRAGFYGLPDEVELGDAEFDAWIDHAEARGWDPEAIDMALSFC